MNIHWLWPALAVASFVLTRAMLRFEATRQMLDVPNERSSHDRPIPRGGGIAIVLTFLAGVLIAGFAGVLDTRLIAAVLGGGVLVALVGLADDLRDVPATWRLLLHMLAAVWVLYWLGGIPGTLLPGVPPLLLNGIGVLCIVWLINLFNFMDGIDGIAGIEAVTVCLGGIILYLFRAPGETAWIIPAIILASVAGFLCWNYPPARIFLGDAGSGFLGIMMAVFCIQGGLVDPVLFWGWIILLGVFVVDASVTLARRMLRRQRVEQAHRSHAYQVAARQFGGHAPVSLAVGAINLAWLLPLAFLAATARAPAVPLLLFAYAPLILLALRFKAGAHELQGFE